MKLWRYISVKLALSITVGILFGHYYSVPPNYGQIGVLLCLITIGLGLKYQTRNGLPVTEFGAFAGVVMLGILSYSLQLPQYQEHHFSKAKANTQSNYQLQILEELKPTTFGKRFIAKVYAVDDTPTTGNILLQIKNDNKIEFTIGELLVTPYRPESVKPPFNPHQFNYKRYLQTIGVHHQLSVASYDILPTGKVKSSILTWVAQRRQKIIAQLKTEAFGPQELAVVQALVLGQRNDLTENTYNAYKKAGAIHLLAVSGLHVGVVLLLLQFLLSPLKYWSKGRNLGLLLSILGLWCYALFTGLSPSIVRATTMFSFISYALWLNRPTNTFNILALSYFFMLLWQPNFLFQVGFQLSYAAVFAIAWLYPSLQRFWYPDNKILLKLWQLISVSIAAQIGVLPLSLFYFHQFPSLFFIANILIIPFLGLVLGLGFLVLFLSTLKLLPMWLVVFYNDVIKIMNTLITWVAQQEAFFFDSIAFDAWQMLLTYATLISLLYWLTTRKEIAFKIFIPLALLLVSYTLFKPSFFSNNQVILPHQYKTSALIAQNKDSLTVYGLPEATSMLHTFVLGEDIKSIKHSTLPNAFSYESLAIVRIDSLALLPETKAIDVLWLSHSPKIHLEKVIDTYRPKYIISDGSNFPHLVQLWKASCTKKEIPFHHTGEKGAFYFKWLTD
ncbi:ComEC/Rec2 family competence protein [Flavobacterium sp. ASW18X]|uniref:ComEC/Rec2 family competence protein n=1 Tax=Flavobacterium sp. ASW18X TaxID=2572595 RepID=UPI0010ADEC06|nr:ComEC/Rec2 family competence protein [Flavobacterium sp. ASW18X]TKD60971.1 ComEC/Rec2 family competence protein [Flavobacterium sp. ASW18X]